MASSQWFVPEEGIPGPSVPTLWVLTGLRSRSRSVSGTCWWWGCRAGGWRGRSRPRPGPGTASSLREGEERPGRGIRPGMMIAEPW